MHYKEATLNYYRVNWIRLIHYFESRNEEFFSEAVAMEYVDEKCDFFAKEKSGLLTQSNIYLFRIIRMIGDFQSHGTVSRRYEKPPRINEPEHIKLLEVLTHIANRAIILFQRKSYCRVTENFLSFGITMLFRTGSRSGIYDGLCKTLMGYSYKMVEFTLCGIRSFLRFLHSEQILKRYIRMFAMSQISQANTYPSVWNRDDLQKLLDAIDRKIHQANGIMRLYCLSHGLV